jgi:hypothetical protein
MAKQKGAHRLTGTIGELTYYKSKNGYIVRETSPLSAERLATDPAFARTRENMSEFGHAGKSGKYLRGAFRSLIQNAKDSTLVGRLTKEIMRVIKTDSVSPRGQRNLTEADTAMLQGFDFNNDAKLQATIFAPFDATINRVTGAATVAIPPFVPVNEVVAPSGATHYKIVSTAAEIDFATGTTVTDSQLSGTLPLDAAPTVAINLANALTPNSTHTLFLVLGIQFFQEVNGVFYSLRNGAFNALSIVKVS